MKRTTTFAQRLRCSSLASLVLAGLFLGGFHAYANSEPFSHISLFGDSLTDTGNFYRLSAGYPPSPYFEGRFCNGPLWVEYLAAELGMQYDHQSPQSPGRRGTEPVDAHVFTQQRGGAS